MMWFLTVRAFRGCRYVGLKFVKAQLGGMVFAADGADLRSSASTFVMSIFLAAITAERFRSKSFSGEGSPDGEVNSFGNWSFKGGHNLAGGLSGPCSTSGGTGDVGEQLQRFEGQLYRVVEYNGLGDTFSRV